MDRTRIILATVKLFDHRDGAGEDLQIAEIPIHIYQVSRSSRDHYWNIGAQELLTNIQNSPSRIEGAHRG